MNSLTKIATFVTENSLNNLVKLEPEFVVIFERLAKIGKVSATLFAGALVHNVSGQFANMRNRSNTLMHFHPNIDTRLFTAKWRYVYATTYATEQNKIICLDFFSRYGDLIYRVCSTNLEQYSQFKEIISDFAVEDQTNLIPIINDNFKKIPYIKPINEVVLKKNWAAMTNVHQASKIFKSYGNDQITVYKLLGKDYARKINTGNLVKFINYIVENKLNLMMFARNYAAVQCYVGKLEHLQQTKNKIVVKMTDFDFTLWLQQLGDTWLITKPTDSGIVNSLSIFDKANNEILILTAKRTRHEAEDSNWIAAVKLLN